MERLGIYEFNVFRNEKGWFYEIYNDDLDHVIKSNEIFDFKNITRIAAIGHISLLDEYGDSFNPQY